MPKNDMSHGDKHSKSKQKTLLPYQPDNLSGTVDVIGVLPEEISVDPDITEGHPGYEESGPSEIRPSSSPRSK